MALTRNFKETVIQRVQADASFAQALLDEAATLFLNGEPETARLILRAVSYTHLRAHETSLHLVCRLLLKKKIFLMIRRPPRSTPLYSSAASDVYKRQANKTLALSMSRCCPRLVPPPNKMMSCLLYTSPSPRDLSTSRMPSSA